MATYIEGELPNDGITVRQGKNGVLVREEKREFTVVADNPFIDKLTVLATSDLPTFGQIVNGMTVRSMNADREADHQYRWKVTIGLSSEVSEDNSNNPGGGGGDPTGWTPIARVSFESYETVVRKDLDKPKPKVWLNSAKRPFDTGLSITKRVASVPFTQFESISSTTLDQIMDRCDTINSTTYKTRDKHLLLLVVDDANIVTINGFRCWRVDYTCKLKKDSWIFEQLDHGPGFYDSANKYVRFYEEQWDNNGTYQATVTGLTPFLGLLNGSGGALTNQRTGDPYFIKFQTYEEMDFNSFLRVQFT